jgi:hypothetical protein
MIFDNIMLCEKKVRDKTCFFHLAIFSNKNKNNHPKQIPHITVSQK